MERYFMKKRRRKNDFWYCLILSLLIFGLLTIKDSFANDQELTQDKPVVSFDISDIPPYTKDSYVYINDNIPFFTEDDFTSNTFEIYGELDSLGRCTYAFANVSRDTMPTEERASIGGVKPSGWHTVKYEIVSGKYLYNRCHLIGYQLTGENANTQNLITCTRQTNTGTMLEFENLVAEYVKNTGNHVLYRATPIFEGDNLLASGIELEAMSIEDQGRGIKFNVYLYNVQDGIEIDYATGESKLAQK